MEALISWYWKNTFIMSIIAIELCLCIRKTRRKNAFPIWLVFTSAILVLSNVLTRPWEWDGNLLSWQSTIFTFVMRILMLGISVAQILAVFETDVWNAAFVMLISVGCQSVQFALYKLLEVTLLGVDVQRMPGVPSILLNLFTLALTCGIVYFIFVRKGRSRLRLDSYNRHIIIVAALIKTIENVLNLILYLTDSSANFGATMVVMRVYTITFNLVNLFMLYNLITRRSAEMEQLKMQNIMRERENQYRFSKELINSINIKSHDLKKQIGYLKESASEHREFFNEVENLTNEYDSIIHTASPALSAVLTEKSLFCARNNIPFTCVGNGDGLEFMRGVDIYTLFANLLDNAIEASLKMETGRGSIQLVIKRQYDFVSVHCVNYYSGDILEENGELLTLKKDKDNHGFGVKSIVEIAEKYNGTACYRTEGETFIVNILLPISEQQ